MTMFTFNRVILLQINKITFEKKWKPRRKNHISQNLAKTLTGFFSELFSLFFLNSPGGNAIWKPRQNALPNLHYISSMGYYYSSSTSLHNMSTMKYLMAENCSFYNNI